MALAALLVAASGAFHQPVHDLATDPAGLTVQGVHTVDQLGWIVASGDFNGDGNADLLVTARLADPGGAGNEGAAYVIFGPRSGVIDLAQCPGDPNHCADVVIEGPAKPGVLTIPREALIRSGRSERVVLALGDGRFRSVEVVSGMESDGSIEILEGLDEGDEIVVSAQFLIDSESSLKASFIRMDEPKPSMEMASMEVAQADTGDAIEGVVAPAHSSPSTRRRMQSQASDLPSMPKSANTKHLDLSPPQWLRSRLAVGTTMDSPAGSTGGIEPPTPAMSRRCSKPLSYVPEPS